MGIFNSKPSTPLDPENTLDYLFKGIFSDIDLLDMYAMMDTKKCSEYIIFGKKALEAIFAKLNIEPAKGEDGVVFFRKITTLRSQLMNNEQHGKLCAEISLYFALILRSFAALYFTIKKTGESVETIAGVIANPTDRMFRKKGIIEQFFKPFQKGGRIQHDQIRRENQGLMGQFIIDNFSARDNNILTLESGDKIIEINRSAIKGLKGIQLIPPSSGASPSTPMSPVAVTPAKITDEPVHCKYSFLFDKNRYALTFTLHVTRSDYGENIYKIILSEFKWEIPPPNSIPFENKQIVLDNIFVFGSRDGPVWATEKREYASAIMFYEIRRLTNAQWINPNTTTSDYLVKWRYLPESSYSDKTVLNNISPKDLALDESTRRNTSVSIIYSVPGIAIPERTEKITIYITCVVSIIRQADRTNEKRYTVTIDNMTAESQTGINIEGVFTELSAPIQKIFKALSDLEPPRMLEYGYDIPTFIRRAANAQVKKNIRASDIAYRKKDNYLRLPTIDTTNPYDFGTLQKLMAPERSPFPACTALAAELMQKLTNETFYTSVCNTKFTARVNGSLPKINRKTNEPNLMSSSGIVALSALFLNSMNDSATRVVKSDEWKKFEENMKRVNSVTLKGRCKMDGNMELESSLVGEIEGIVQQLVDRQEEHKHQAFILIWELFDKEYAYEKKGFSLNPNLKTGGIEYLKEIKNRCIDLLTKYYVDCDTLYLNGLKIIIDKQGQLEKSKVVPRAIGPKVERDITEMNNNDNDDDANLREALLRARPKRAERERDGFYLDEI